MDYFSNSTRNPPVEPPPAARKPEVKKQDVVVMNSNPYDFFDNDEDNQDNQSMSGGVIPTSMFD